MKLILIILLAIFLSACTREKKNADMTESKKDSLAQQKDKTETKTEKGVKDSTEISSSLSNIEYGVSSLPPNLTGYKGKIVAMAKWEDNMGANVLFITETEERSSGKNRSKELFGYHYTITGKENKLIWKINDFVNDCPVDLTLKVIEKSVTITDLDKDGIAESSFIYRMSCKGDVSPDDMKLIMHEGETKYAIRGQMRLTVAGEGSYGGGMKVDPSFDKAPEQFLEHAKSLWNKYVNEKAG